MSDSSLKSIAILGAGITGLTAAHRLTKLGHRVRIFEKNDRAGGVVKTDIVNGWLCENGPNSLLENEPALSALIEELGLLPEKVAANPTAKKRFIVRDGQPQALPASPPAFIRSPLFSLGSKLRLVSELFTRRRQRTGDLSLADFIEHHFGQEIVDYALNPFVAGVYAGDPEKLSTRHSFPALWAMEQSHGSIIRGQIAQARTRRANGTPRGGIISFRRGLQTLTDALTRALPAESVILNAQVETIISDSSWHVIWHDGQKSHNEGFDLVLSALPAGPLSQLQIGSLGERPLAALTSIVHPPVEALVLGYRQDQIAHPLDGFGMLVPALEKRSILGVLFSSTLFPGRAPDGHHALTVMVGGTRQPELTGLETSDLLHRINPDLVELLGVKDDPVFQHHHAWKRAIPQYDIGYERFLQAMTDCEQQHPGLLIGGQVRDGISVPACIAAGEKLAARAVAG